LIGTKLILQEKSFRLTMRLNNAMKPFLSKLLYYIGDFISFFLRFNAFSFIYPLYAKIMLKSCDLDKHGKVWKIVKKRKLHE
jgi:hypothetical protein